MLDTERNSLVVGQAWPGQVKTVLLESAQSPGTRHGVKIESGLGPGQNELGLIVNVKQGISLQVEEPSSGKKK